MREGEGKEGELFNLIELNSILFVNLPFGVYKVLTD